MRFKIQPGASSLCTNCEESQMIRFTNGRVDILCHRGMKPFRLPGAVVECNSFSQRNTASRHEMEQIAWTVTTDKSGKTIGFEPPKKDQS